MEPVSSLTLKVPVIDTLIDRQVYFAALGIVKAQGDFFPEYVKRFVAKKLRSDIRQLRETLKYIEDEINVCYPKRTRSKKKKSPAVSNGVG
jgi:hypothetical protein